MGMATTKNTNTTKTIKNTSTTKNTNNKKTGISYIAIPQNLIYDNNLNTKAKYLYIILKKHAVSDKVNIGYDKLMDSLVWSDKRTLKRYLEILRQYNYIDYEFDRIGKLHSLEMKIEFNKPFIQIDRELVE